MTDIRGLLKDVNDEDSLISVVNVSEVPMLKREEHRKQDGFRNGIDRRAEWTELRGCCKCRGAACDHGISQRRICAYTGIFFSR